MPRNSPTTAYKRYFEALQTAVSCITHGRLVGLRPNVPPELNRVYSLVLNGGDPVVLGGEWGISLSVGQAFRIIEDPEADSGPYRATTVEYWYQFEDQTGKQLLTYHWTPETADPQQRRYPHLHVGSSVIDPHGPFTPDQVSRLHVPTERVSLEAIVRFAIQELGVRPIRRDWEKTLSEGQDAFVQHRRTGWLPRAFRP